MNVISSFPFRGEGTRVSDIGTPLVEIREILSNKIFYLGGWAVYKAPLENPWMVGGIPRESG